MSPITQKIRKLFALLLALCLPLSLAACGKDKKEANDSSEQLSDTVYVPEFLDLSAAGEIESLQSACAIGNSIFLLATITEEEASDPVTGDATSTALFRVDTDGTVERLTNYEPLPVPEGMDGYSDPTNIAAGPGDTLWVTEYMTYYKLDLPEDFDPVYGSKSNYMTDYTERKMLRQLDTTGSEITRLDTTYLSRKLAPAGTGFSYGDSTSEYLIDGEGNLWTAAITGLWAVDSELNPLFSLSLDGDPPVVLGDGTVGKLSRYLDTLTGTSGYQLQVADMESQSWETAYLLPNEASKVYPGGGDYLFYYLVRDTLYGCRADTAVPTENGQLQAVGEELLSWMDVNIAPSSIVSFTFLSNGQVAVFTREQEDWAYLSGTRYTYDLALLTPAERSSVPEKTVLTYGVMYISSEERKRIVEFNRNSDEYHIEIVDYAEFNSDEDPLASYTRLGAEIMSGTIPDILSTSSMPMEQMGARGLLEDLWPYIDSDTELGGREALMTRVLDAASYREGHLYQVFSTFAISTVTGAPSVVGDRMRWTVADLEDALAKMPEGCAIFSELDTARSVLGDILRRNLNSFVNWETGECSFDSGEFRSLLQFCAGFPYDTSATSTGGDWYKEIWLSL